MHTLTAGIRAFWNTFCWQPFSQDSLIITLSNVQISKTQHIQIRCTHTPNEYIYYENANKTSQQNSRVAILKIQYCLIWWNYFIPHRYVVKSYKKLNYRHMLFALTRQNKKCIYFC